jgi:hypothetical protein
VTDMRSHSVRCRLIEPVQIQQLPLTQMRHRSLKGESHAR